VSFEADRAAQVLPDPGVAVVPIVAIHGAQVPWGRVVTKGVPVVATQRLPSLLLALPAVLGPERVAWLADQAGSASTPAPNLFHSQGPQVGQREASSCLPMRTRVAAVTASRRLARPRSWRIFSLWTCTASRCRCVDRSTFGQRKQAGRY
jgi:hypothetical protein